MTKIKIFLKITIFFISATSALSLHAENNPTAQAKQLVTVISEDWNSTAGILLRFERSSIDADWQRVGEKISVNLGKNGMGWGSGLHGDPLSTETPIKVDGPIITGEGLKRSPAGAYAIPTAFGKDAAEDWGVKLPYDRISKTLYYSCDKSYNRIVDIAIAEEQEDWDRGESMQHYVDDSGLYNYGAMIAHNYSPSIYKRGCCFFIHVWRGPGRPTAGCTAMAAENAKELVSWLDPKGNPVLVQFPKETYDSFKDQWELPDLSPVFVKEEL